MEKSNDTSAKAAATLGAAKARKLHAQSHQRCAEARESTKRALLAKLQEEHGDDFMQLKNASMGTLWRQFVRNRNDAEAFMEVMYPQFQEPIRRAYVLMFERAVRGEIDLDEKLIYKKEDVAKVWDPVQEMKEEKLKGLINLTTHRLEKLLEDERMAVPMTNKV